MDIQTILQRQMEVQGVLREPLRTPSDVANAQLQFKGFSKFVVWISRTSTRIQVPLELVVQCLLHMDAGKVDFDKQHGKGNVPMHQAKVLDRGDVLAEQQVEQKLRGAEEPEKLTEMIRQCDSMRRVMRMKVEDGNDFSMARKAVGLAEEFFDTLAMLAEDDPEKMWRMYCAEDQANFLACLGVGEGGEYTAAGASLTGSLSSTYRVDHERCGVAKAVATILKDMAPTPSNVQERLGKLQALHGLLAECDVSQITPAVVASMRDAIAPQLQEKRSAILRAASDVVCRLVCVVDSYVMDAAEWRETVTVWVAALLKQVHVTVAVIAQACDSTVRELVLSTRKCGSVMGVVCRVAEKAPQAELRRKCLGYLCLGIIVSDTHAAFQRVWKVAVESSSHSDEHVRRAARLLIIVVQNHTLSLDAGMELMLDARTQKAVDSEKLAVLSCTTRPQLFETKVLRYKQPSQFAFNTSRTSSTSPPAVDTLPPIESKQSRALPAEKPWKAKRVAAAPKQQAQDDVIVVTAPKVKPSVVSQVAPQLASMKRESGRIADDEDGGSPTPRVDEAAPSVTNAKKSMVSNLKRRVSGTAVPPEADQPAPVITKETTTAAPWRGLVEKPWKNKALREKAHDTNDDVAVLVKEPVRKASAPAAVRAAPVPAAVPTTSPKPAVEVKQQSTPAAAAAASPPTTSAADADPTTAAKPWKVKSKKAVADPLDGFVVAVAPGSAPAAGGTIDRSSVDRQPASTGTPVQAPAVGRTSPSTTMAQLDSNVAPSKSRAAEKKPEAKSVQHDAPYAKSFLAEFAAQETGEQPPSGKTQLRGARTFRDFVKGLEGGTDQKGIPLSLRSLSMEHLAGAQSTMAAKSTKDRISPSLKAKMRKPSSAPVADATETEWM